MIKVDIVNEVSKIADITKVKAEVAVDAVFDSVSVVTTFRDELKKAGVIFCSLSEAVHTHPELVRQYLGSALLQEQTAIYDGSIRYHEVITRYLQMLAGHARDAPPGHRFSPGARWR